MKYDIDFEDPAVISSLIKTMIAKTPVAYIVLDKEYRVHFINDYFLKFRKLDQSDVLGVQCFCISNGGVPCNVCAVRQAIATGQKCVVMRKDVLPDGTIRYMDDYAIPLYKEDGKSFDFILEIMVNRSQEMVLRDQANKIFYDIVKILTSVLDKKDAYTSTHSLDVSSISTKLAKFIGLSEEAIYNIGLGALLHDIGKVQIPDQIINKTSSLTNEEFAEIKRHPFQSFHLLKDLQGFEDIKEMSLSHHEKWNGTGYPNALKGEEIPLGGRIIGIADTYDAMTSDRSYRKGLSHEVAIAEIKAFKGTQFDPFLVDKFVEMATQCFNSREELLEKDTEAVAAFLKKKNDKNAVVRMIQKPIKGLDGNDSQCDLKDITFDDKFITEIFKNTPAFYTVVSEAFDVLYVSDSISKALNCESKDLVGGKCFEVNHKNMTCFKVNNGQLACPVVRSFHTGTEQKGNVIEQIGNLKMYMDIYAVPIEIMNKHGIPIKCAMEILFDRTEETVMQLRLEKDIQTLINMLEGLIQSIDPSATGNADAIIAECDSFGDYIAKLNEKICAQYEDIL